MDFIKNFIEDYKRMKKEPKEKELLGLVIIMFGFIFFMLYGISVKNDIDSYNKWVEEYGLEIRDDYFVVDELDIVIQRDITDEREVMYIPKKRRDRAVYMNAVILLFLLVYMYGLYIKIIYKWIKKQKLYKG